MLILFIGSIILILVFRVIFKYVFLLFEMNILYRMIYFLRKKIS